MEYECYEATSIPFVRKKNDFIQQFVSVASQNSVRYLRPVDILQRRIKLSRVWNDGGVSD